MGYLDFGLELFLIAGLELHGLVFAHLLFLLELFAQVVSKSVREMGTCRVWLFRVRGVAG